MGTNDPFRHKKIESEDLAGIVKPGNRIFVSSDPATPVKTLFAILDSNIADLEFIQLATLGDHFSTQQDARSTFRLKTFRVGENIGMAFKGGHVDFVPTNMAEIPYLFVSGAVGVDVAIIQTSQPHGNGNLNLGVVNDLTGVVIANTPVVIAETNPNVPITSGSTDIRIDDVNHLLESDHPLYELKLGPNDEVFDKIGWHVANLIDNGSTISMGAGLIFDGIAKHLQDKKDLRIRSHVISDWVIGLCESGALVRRNFITRANPVAATACVGSKRLYDYTNNNPNFEILPLLQSSYQAALPRTQGLISVLNVQGIDVSGESVSISNVERQLAGFDAKLSFSLAATHSRGGKAIVALRSADCDGNSNIVISHNGGHRRSTLGSTHYVVTEYGIANIFGKPIRERALAIIDIAHPDHREELIEKAKQAGCIYPDQAYNVRNVLNYPHTLQQAATFKKKGNIIFRPLKPSDEEMMRRFFYRQSSESSTMRYLAPRTTMRHGEVQPYIQIDYEKTLSVVAIAQQRGIESIVAECRYAYDQTNDEYEFAIAVDEDYQRLGIATLMLDLILSTAKSRGIKKIVGHVLGENESMFAVLKKTAMTPDVIGHGVQSKVIFDLTDGFEPPFEDLR